MAPKIKPTKKIAFVLTSLRKGGAEGKAYKIITALSDKFEIELLLFNNVVEYQLPEEVKIRALGSRFNLLKDSWLQLPLIFFRLSRLIKQSGVRAICSYDYLPNILSLSNKALGWNGKVVINHINNSSRELQRFGVIKRVFIKTLGAKLYASANHIIVPSEELKADVRGSFKVSTDRISHVTNPIDIKEVLRQARLTPTNLPKDKGNFVFLHVGNLRPEKNHKLLIEAFAELNDLPCELWLIGKGTNDDFLEKEISNNGVENPVHRFGHVDNPFPYMIAANALVLCSDYEGSPNVILEALACGLPIVSTDCSYGPRETLVLTNKTDKVIQIAEHGILTPVGQKSTLASAMRLCIAEPELMEEFRKKAAKRAESFDISRVIKSYLDFFN